MKPGKPLKRSGSLKRSGRWGTPQAAKRRRKRQRQRFKAAFHSPGFVRWVKSLACSVPGCQRTDIECAHVDRPRSRGGRWFEVAPLCVPHHREQEKRTDWFNGRYGIDLRLIAAAVAQRWMAFSETRETARRRTQEDG